jgi:hypothetical protein
VIVGVLVVERCNRCGYTQSARADVYPMLPACVFCGQPLVGVGFEGR